MSRADMAARGLPPATASTWYRDRAKTGHPEKAGRIGRTDYWYEDEWTAWHCEGYLAGAHAGWRVACVIWDGVLAGAGDPCGGSATPRRLVES